MENQVIYKDFVQILTKTVLIIKEENTIQDHVLILVEIDQDPYQDQDQYQVEIPEHL